MLINYKLLDRDLNELNRQYQEEFNEVIEDYTALFADAYCKDMKEEFGSQIDGVNNFMAGDGSQF